MAMVLRIWKVLFLLGVLLSVTQAGSKKDKVRSIRNVTSERTSTSSTSASPIRITVCEKKDSFQCESGHCLPKSFQCDGEKDCKDGSDEVPEICAKIKAEKCSVGEFLCMSDECIDATKKCDGETDCLDGWSDEADCIKPNECLAAEGKFQCKSGDGCVEASKVCDKSFDCPDKSDEFPGCETSCTNTTCTQGCTPNPQGPGTCFCFKGYTFSDRDKGKCVDVDECKKFGTCSQICNNLVGSYECSCMSGFRLSKDNSSCELIDNNPTLVFALHSSVGAKRIDKNEEHYYFIVENQGAPVSVAYDARNSWVYWTDVDYHKEAVWRSKLDGSEKKKIVSSGLTLPEGIAFDWIGNNIYFTDSGHSHIVVCTADGVNCTVLIKEQMDKPRDLAVHPNLGLLFWTDWGISPSIIRAGMDGSTPLVIVSEDLKWPNGIAIDQGNSRIYWTDAGTDRIESANFDGSDRQIIHSVGIKHPFDVEVLGDDIYWSDWNLYEIQKSNKLDGSQHEILIKEQYEQLNGVALVHKANQPITRRNQCKDAGCSHICVLTPQNSNRCLCPEGMLLDKKTKRVCSVDPKFAPLPFPTQFNNTVKTPSKTDQGILFTPTTTTTKSTTPSKSKPTSKAKDFPEYTVDEGFAWEDSDDGIRGKSSSDRKNKKPKKPKVDRFNNAETSSDVAVMRNGRILSPDESVMEEEPSSDENGVGVSDVAHPLAIALGVIVILLLLGTAIGIFLYRKNVHPKVLVRPYVQSWVRYVNQPVGRFFENRGEPLDGGKKKRVYDNVYQNTTQENTYTSGYENVDAVTDDTSVHIYDEPEDNHRINYNQKERLLD